MPPREIIVRVKNLVTSFTATFDQFAKRVENHEAVAENVLADVRKAAARLRVQAGRIQADIDRRRNTQKTALQSAEQWRKRALSQPEAGKEQAIECLRRAEQAQHAADSTDQQIARCEGLLAEVQSAQRDVEARLVDLKLRKSALASRDARVDALSVSYDPILCEEVDAVFERWEHAVIEKEYLDGSSCAISDSPGARMDDRFERDFERAETDAALEATLAALKAEADEESSK